MSVIWSLMKKHDLNDSEALLNRIVLMPSVYTAIERGVAEAIARYPHLQSDRVSYEKYAYFVDKNKARILLELVYDTGATVAVFIEQNGWAYLH